MKTGPELIAEIAKFPTLDLMLDRNPHLQPYNDDELRQLVERERLERALANVKDDERRSKKREKQEDVA